MGISHSVAVCLTLPIVVLALVLPELSEAAFLDIANSPFYISGLVLGRPVGVPPRGLKNGLALPSPPKKALAKPPPRSFAPADRPVAADAASWSAVGQLVAGATYKSIYFSGCGFLLPFHFGVVAALRDHGVKFEQASATSGGVMAALAILDAANLELGIRQCFDLRAEPAAMPWCPQSFFDMYRRYFRAFRDAAAKARVPLAELRGRLFVRLGRVAFKWGPAAKGLAWDGIELSDFASEEELEDSFMSAAYVPGVTALQPPAPIRGRAFLDAALADRWRPGNLDKIALHNRSLFPPSAAPPSPPEAAAGDCAPASNPSAAVATGTQEGPRPAVVRPERVVVLANGRPLDDPKGLVAISGCPKRALDFFASHQVQRAAFLEGYELAARSVDAASLSAEKRQELAAKRLGAEAMIDRILAEQAAWKGAVAQGVAVQGPATEPALAAQAMAAV
eukprot:CAMPEP_0172599302 /NCGR_PEP_ID=MMETSP1068-20121228/19365_1 /TAXON_ID=35684 /ORGANISM="Pseudopedinella elastica, Strain CCMP716" /LENGTH=450 /DNA_ID=CAMNT_0013399511 /DNA_START=80 /DNA_END=1432 /DNA_ORIENTATION=+